MESQQPHLVSCMLDTLFPLTVFYYHLFHIPENIHCFLHGLTLNLLFIIGILDYSTTTMLLIHTCNKRRRYMIRLYRTAVEQTELTEVWRPRRSARSNLLPLFTHPRFVLQPIRARYDKAPKATSRYPSQPRKLVTERKHNVSYIRVFCYWVCRRVVPTQQMKRFHPLF